MEKYEHIHELVKPIREDLQSGAAEIALRAITVFQTVMNGPASANPDELKAALHDAVKELLEAQPAMAPLFHLCNEVLLAVGDAKTVEQIQKNCQDALQTFERTPVRKRRQHRRKDV